MDITFPSLFSLAVSWQCDQLVQSAADHGLPVRRSALRNKKGRPLAAAQRFTEPRRGMSRRLRSRHGSEHPGQWLADRSAHTHALLSWHRRPLFRRTSGRAISRCGTLPDRLGDREMRTTTREQTQRLIGGGSYSGTGQGFGGGRRKLRQRLSWGWLAGGPTGIATSITRSSCAYVALSVLRRAAIRRSTAARTSPRTSIR
jgi:hypothetical protein